MGGFLYFYGMVKDTELRKGSLLLLGENDPQITCRVETIGPLGACCRILGIEEGAVIMYDNLFPIPLTPELLERCGFIYGEDEDDLRYYEHPESVIDFQADVDFGDGKNTFSQVNPILKYKLEFLHQLQNLFFALEGYELEIKQPILA